ncbi:sugar phosphate isomerase/epimerase family protein [Phytohalomonas tamaricis]|uniref:sugar phosphate isomerase/epimerase family protein n=1 Tax=Phytohalomonas tamaricis TaxID=2081032 RepID=UPI0021D42AD0|nr:sugar phosphate isomerase/epimerase family protein [Phytohalomonas tamaricis]
MAIGIRAHDLVVKDDTPESLADAASREEFQTVQLAMAKSFNVGGRPGMLNPGLAHRIGQEFAKRNVRVSVLACYDNIIHPDAGARAMALARFKDHIRFCRDIGSSIVATETGNVNSEIVYTEENFSEKPFMEVVDSVKRLVEEAEKFSVMVGIEPGVNHPIYSPETLSRLIEDVQSDCLQVIFDPVNLLTFKNHENQAEIFSKALDLWGDRIVAVHAKDFTIENKKVVTVPVGEGLIDYDFLMAKIARLKPELDVILDEVRPANTQDSRRFILEKMTTHNVNIWPAPTRH